MIVIIDEPEAEKLDLTFADTEHSSNIVRLIPKHAASIFDVVDVGDGYARRQRDRKWRELLSARRTFRLESDFWERATYFRPAKPGATVSEFCSWVHSLYVTGGPSLDAMEKGLEAEKSIYKLRGAEFWRAHMPVPDNHFLEQSNSEWELIHNGLHLMPGQEFVPYWKIASLLVGGQPLRGSPDLLYRNKSTGAVVVVEIKFSNKVVPENLWPDIWAQLWCYSHIPEVRAAPSVTLVGEVWGERMTFRRMRIKGYGVHTEQVNFLHLRASVRRDPRRPAFHKFFLKLFDVYRGAA